MVIPTLAADESLAECMASLERQTFRDFEVIVVDNSGEGLARGRGGAARILEEATNAGFGAAINHAAAASRSRYIATINDDAVADENWLAALISALEAHPEAGMCASRVRLLGTSLLDSAGMLVAADGTSKQRGHGEPAGNYAHSEDVLLPSGSAAIYRRTAFTAAGGFDDDFFLYCEDTDLGLRLRWAGWTCLYAPDALVDHRYSHSAGRASPLKAYLVERNRLFTIVKNYPLLDVMQAFPASAARYTWHLVYLLRGRGKAAEFRASGNTGWKLGWYVLRAHAAALLALPQLLRKRAQIRVARKVSAAHFRTLLQSYSIQVRRVAQL